MQTGPHPRPRRRTGRRRTWRGGGRARCWRRPSLRCGFYVVSYGLDIYLLSLLIGFLSPMVDPELEALDAAGPALPTRLLPEFKFCVFDNWFDSVVFDNWFDSVEPRVTVTLLPLAHRHRRPSSIVRRHGPIQGTPTVSSRAPPPLGSGTSRLVLLVLGFCFGSDRRVLLCCALQYRPSSSFNGPQWSTNSGAPVWNNDNSLTVGSRDRVCRAFVEGKMHDSPHPSKTIISSKRILELLHVDLFGPTTHASLGAKKYCLVIVDEYSRYTWVYFLKKKDETQQIFIDFATEVQRQHNLLIMEIRSDNGSEFKNYTLNDFLSDEGIRHQYSAAYTPQQNGVAERKNRTLMDMARSMMAEYKSRYKFWAEAISTACHSSNRLYLRKGLNKTPYEILTGNKPNISYFKVFGCKCFYKIKGVRLFKFAPKALEGIFVGYGSKSHTYRVFDVSSKIIIESCSVKFEENDGSQVGQVDVCAGDEIPQDAILMTDRFEMSMMGEMRFFLGFEIKQLREGTFINQAKYLQDMLKRFKMTEMKGVATPMVIECHLALDPNGPDYPAPELAGLSGLAGLSAPRDPGLSGLGRQKNWYDDVERDIDIEDQRFWCMEQSYIFKDIYEPMKKVRPMQAIDVEFLSQNDHFEDAIWVNGRMGLQKLMKVQCDYSPDLIKQFHATLAFKKDEERIIQWMSGSSPCAASFRRFTAVLGLPYEGVHRFHGPQKTDKDVLYDIYMTTLELLVLPRGFYLFMCAQDGDEESDFTLDIMDYIFNEIHDAMVSRTTMPYAPYIQLLINNTALAEDLSQFPTESHTFKKAYKKKPVAPTAPVSGSFMGDARSSGYAPGRHVATPLIQKHVKKLSWFQRNVLCMNIEIHKENFEASRQRSEIQHTQAVILHRLSGEQGPPP
ncbi:hypothetical protein QYE76_023905 [Lolium multiflorum]|uniref:Integrase catalytic domain-containing protein n=1 Tax=Lolium multiflorum TaxID=4521 RepID=A0AAD8RFQ6_LOLMU|nr:hypothetical protein QYE76_023905 [Lolium multiflorum]